MKKLLVLLAALMAVFALSACAPTYEIALVTDVGTIDDGSFNQGAWEGVVKYAEEHDISHTHYRPVEDTTDARIDAIKLAIDGGAKTVVCPGFLFSDAVFAVQDDYPEVKFIVLDAYPHNGDYVPAISDNTLSIAYAEHESGFLAGYAAVKEGFTKLGFVGGMSVPAVVKFGYGFIQGANAAAIELELAADAVTIEYWYSGVFWETPEVKDKAVAWYQSGVEVIFAAAGGAGASVMTAAEQEGAKVIGVDIDQATHSDTVITSALKELANSVYDSLATIYDDTFAGGNIVDFNAANNGVGLPADLSRFSTFDQAAYDAIFAQLADGSVVVDPEVFDGTHVTVTGLDQE